MKAKHTLILTSFFRAALCFLIMATTSSCAAEDSIKRENTEPFFPKVDLLSVDFNRLRTAKSATYILVPWSDLTLLKYKYKSLSWDESTFKKIGCAYSTSDPAQISSLLEIIRRSDLKTRPRDIDVMNVVREGVYLNFADGTEAKFLFSSEVGLSETVGQFTHDSMSKDFSLIANRSLPWYLTFWASHLAPAVADEFSADACARFIKGVIYRQRDH
jgi:hypothetical protein